MITATSLRQEWGSRGCCRLAWPEQEGMKFKCSLVAEFKSSLPGFPAESPQASLSLGFLQNGAVNPYLP